ncbi:uncharacterized protein LOC117282154 [Cryptotermes secundus]|uniref:uncharacterized protein LOC117282154 n=1 Tax=Cryptotermes secundus TaxID=105785 RepID=UPI001454BC29|nr:uncharacterized protein LOC117282154 [Cryptotermes secundus]
MVWAIYGWVLLFKMMMLSADGSIKVSEVSTTALCIVGEVTNSERCLPAHRWNKVGRMEFDCNVPNKLFCVIHLPNKTSNITCFTSSPQSNMCLQNWQVSSSPC